MTKYYNYNIYQLNDMIYLHIIPSPIKCAPLHLYKFNAHQQIIYSDEEL